MFETCYLHCGHAKTGSTSIQATFDANRALIESETGFMFPDAHNAARGNHMLLAANPYIQGQRGMLNVVEGNELLQNVLQEGRDRGGDLVLSSEAIFSLNEAELLNLKTDLLSGCKHIKVVIYIRHPVAYAPSFSQTQIKNNLRSLQQCAADPKFVHYRPVLKKYIKVFGRENLIIRDFARSRLERQDIIADFLNTVSQRPDIVDLPGFEVKRVNESLSLQAAVVADYMYRTWPSELGVGSRRVKAFLATIAGDRFSLPLNSQSIVETKMNADLTFLKNEFGIEPELEGPLQYADVDYQAALTPSLKSQATQFMEQLRLERAASSRSGK